METRLTVYRPLDIQGRVPRYGPDQLEGSGLLLAKPGFWTRAGLSEKHHRHLAPSVTCVVVKISCRRQDFLHLKSNTEIKCGSMDSFYLMLEGCNLRFERKGVDK
jgi:hypothetical protein